MNYFAWMIILTPCMLPLLGIGLLAAASVWRSLREDARRRER